MRLVGTPSELPTTVPTSSGEVRGAHGRFEVLAMDDEDTDIVVCATSFEEGFERDLGPPTTAILVDEAEPTQWESGADFSPVSRSVSSLEMESDGESVVSGEAHVELALIQLSPVLREVFRRGQDRFGDHSLQESGGDEDGASFFGKKQYRSALHTATTEATRSQVS